MNGNDWMDRRLEGRRNGRFIGWIVITALACLVALGVAVNALLAGIGAIHDSSEPVGAKTIVIAVVFFLIAALFAAAAVHCEHRLRGAPPGRFSSGLSASQASPAGSRRFGRRRRNSPTSLLIAGIVILGLGIGAIALAIGAHAAASKSSYTQSNGIQDSATVDNVSNYSSSGRGGTTYWASIAATLGRPVDGQWTTVVNIPNNVNYHTGQAISILVDPADPGYSELPGQRYATDSTTAGAAIGSLVGLVIGVATIINSFRMRARLRALRMEATPGVPAEGGAHPARLEPGEPDAASG
jgi:hypothetical protein